MSYSAQQLYCLQQMGITVYVDQQAPAPVAAELASASVTGLTAMPAAHLQPAADRWQVLQDEVQACQRCPLHQGRTRTVFGVGDVQADWMIIGEAPGRDEDLQGEPFVGRAGKLLDNMLLALGLQREQVFIANILKCRPPNNRDPKPEEVASCEGYLKQQIETIRPRIILAVGRIAAQNLLKVDTAIGRMRGKLYEHPGSNIPVVVTYHPAYLLRSPREKRKAWVDLQFAMKVYNSST